MNYGPGGGEAPRGPRLEGIVTHGFQTEHVAIGTCLAATSPITLPMEAHYTSWSIVSTIHIDGLDIMDGLLWGHVSRLTPTVLCAYAVTSDSMCCCHHCVVHAVTTLEEVCLRDLCIASILLHMELWSFPMLSSIETTFPQSQRAGSRLNSLS